MKTLLVIIALLFPCYPIVSQNDVITPSPSLYVKLEVGEIAFDFPRVGICVEKKLLKHNIWASFHLGSEDLHFGNKSFYYSDPFTYWGIKTGIKRTYPDGSGEYYIGPQLSFDKVSAEISEDVYYDLRNNDAILFDKGIFNRYRVRLFMENGFEFFIGNRFTMELSGGAGISRIEIHYKDVVNPFLLNEVEPRHHHRKSKHKYAGTIWKPALTGAVKFGFRL